MGGEQQGRRESRAVPPGRLLAAPLQIVERQSGDKRQRLEVRDLLVRVVLRVSAGRVGVEAVRDQRLQTWAEDLAQFTFEQCRPRWLMRHEVIVGELE